MSESEFLTTSFPGSLRKFKNLYLTKKGKKMSNYNSLKATIDANIKQNGNQEITGQILNSVLNQMVTTLGAEYQFAGVATIDTNPGTPDAKVFYIANGKGTYEKFGGINVTEDDVVVLYWDSSWHKVATGIASQAKLSELEEYIPNSGGGEETLPIVVASRGKHKYISPSGSIIAYNAYAISEPFELHAGDTISGVVQVSGAASLAIYSGSYEIGTILEVLAETKNFSYTATEDISVVVSGQYNTLSTVTIVRPITKVMAASAASVGDLGNLHTIEKGTIVGAINELAGAGYKELSSLSVGAREVKAEIEGYFFAPVQTDGTNYGTYLDNKIDSVPQGDSFIFITDVHYSSNKKHSAPIIDYVRRRLGIKTIIHGGDVENENEVMANAAKQWLDFNEDFVLRIGTDFKQVCGDHDHNGKYASTGQVFSYQFVQRMMNGYNIHQLVYDTLYDAAIKTYGWTTAELKEYDAWKKMHYFFDDNTINTRFIVLHTGWSGDTGLIWDKIGDCNFLSLQMDFLYYALSTCREGYNVVVIGHDTIINTFVTIEGEHRYDPSVVIYNNAFWVYVSKMILAFKQKQTASSIKYRDWSRQYSGYQDNDLKDYNFANANTPNIVLCIGGDVHWDILAKSTSADTPTKLDSGDSVASTELLQIVTGTDGVDRYYKDLNGNYLFPPVVAGTTNEQAFDIVTLTKDAVYLTRIGTGDDRVIYLTNE